MNLEEFQLQNGNLENRRFSNIAKSSILQSK